MKSNVSYEKSMRGRAINDHKGLYTIDIINASKTPGKLGGRMTFQGPMSADEEKAITEFAFKFLAEREAKSPNPAGSKER